jgi:hypothetical protein
MDFDLQTTTNEREGKRWSPLTLDSRRRPSRNKQQKVVEEEESEAPFALKLD